MGHSTEQSAQGRRGRLPVAIASLAAAILISCVTERLAVAQVSEARTHYEKGRSYFQVSEYRKALEEFKAAHVEKNDPAYIYNIAECHRQLGEPKDAVVFYRRFLRLVPPTHALRADAERRITELEATPASANAASPPPAGREAGPSPSPAPTTPTPTPAASGGAPQPVVESPSPAAAPAAPTPVVGQPAPLLVHDSARDRSGPSGSRRTAAYVVGGAGVLALGVGGYFGLRARSKWRESDPHCPADRCDAVGYALSDQARTSARIADVAIGAGLVGAGVAAYLFFTSRAHPAPSPTAAGRIRLQPEIGPGRYTGLTIGAPW
jgi:hypothetical protein